MTTQRPMVVCYNGACPICRREIDAYRRVAAVAGIRIDWRDIATESDGLSAYGLGMEDGARRLHLIDADGRLLAGIDAFQALWRQLPPTRALAEALDRRPIRQLAEILYEGVLAPVLFALHRRRQRRRKVHG